MVKNDSPYKLYIYSSISTIFNFGKGRCDDYNIPVVKTRKHITWN